MFKNKITELLQIDYPIIQAPMAGGITSTELVSAASNAGVLGMIGAGYMTAQQVKDQISEVRKKTSKPFGVNLFVPDSFTVSSEKLDVMNKLLQPIRNELKMDKDIPVLPTPEKSQRTFDEQLKVLIEEKVPVISFAFGLPTKEVVNKLKNNSIVVIGTATTVREALNAEEIGMDMVVLQGSEAGGHRGTFASHEKTGLVGLMSLIPQAKDAIDIPVIAAGGIMDARGLLASFVLGASAVQMGTAFLTCYESGAHPLYKDAVLSSKDDDTVLTKAFSGKVARGIRNEFITQMDMHQSSVLDYPVQNSITTSIRKAAASQNNASYMSLWCGQSPGLAKKQTVEQLVDTLMGEASSLFHKI